MEDSDEDSIATHTTASSVHSEDEGFTVEQILAEDVNAEGVPQYLVKWEGYPLDRCTWEDRHQFGSGESLAIWRARKRSAESGGERLFDVEEFYEAVEKAAEEKQERSKRREAKRRKRGEVSCLHTYSGGATNYHYHHQILSRSQSPIKPTSSKPAAVRKTAAASPVKKKGVAQKVTKVAQSTQPSAKAKIAGPVPNPPAKAAQSLPQSSGPVRKTAPSGSSLVGSNAPATKRKQRPRVNGDTPKEGPTFKNLATQNRFQSYSRNEPVPDMDSLVMMDLQTGKPILKEAARAPVTNSTGWTSAAAGAPREPAIPERRQSQPNVIRNSPSEAAAAGASKSAGPATLIPSVARTADQARPILKPEPPKRALQQPTKPKVTISQPTTANQAQEIHSAYGRRTFATERRCRSPTPPTPPSAALVQPQVPNLLPFGHPKRKVCKHWQTGSCFYTSEMCQYAHTYDALQGNKAFTCYFWRNGNKCRNTAEQCEFAHQETGSDAAGSARLYTCFYWHNGRACTKTAEECKFAHHETGVVAPPPKGYMQRPTTVAPPSDIDAIDDGPVVTAGPFTTQPHLAKDVRPADKKVAEPVEDNVASNWVVPSSPARHVEDSPAETSAQRIPADLDLARKAVGELDVHRLLSKNDQPIEYVYILMPPERKEEMHLLAKFFAGFNCKVYHSGNSQHWSFFCQSFKEKPSLIVIHPDETFAGTAPQFASFVWRAKGWIFSFGVHEHFDRERAYEARRVFPHGGVTFISDDVFAYYPEKATEVINDFLQKARLKPQGGELSKIGARPGIRDWLSGLAAQKMVEGGDDYTDDRYVNCWEAVCDLCPLEDYDPFAMERDQMVPKDDALLWSVAAEDLPSFEGLWERNEAEATDMMANFFAGTAVERMEEFQKYAFVYQRPDQTNLSDEFPASQLGPQAVLDQVDPCGWMKRYNHIEVMSPDMCLQKSRKRAA